MAAPRSGIARVERDALGEVEVPGAGLYGIHTVRAVTLAASDRRLRHHPAFLHALAAVKHAAARANRDAGVIPAEMGRAIEAACVEIASGKYDEQFPVDLLTGGGGIGINMNVNEVIANLANEALGGVRGTYEPIHPKTHVNASQSTADVCHTATRLAILRCWSPLAGSLSECVRTLQAQAGELRPIITMSRTCLQDGFAVSLGELFDGFAAVVERRRSECDRSMQALRQVNLGGTVIGSEAGAPAAYRAVVLTHLTEITGAPLVHRTNLYDAAQNLDDLAAVSAHLALLAQALIKTAQDLRLLASGPRGGFGEIVLPAVQEGSSFFDRKINPVVPETMLQCGFQVLGCDRAVQLAGERGELYLNIFEGLAAANLFEAIGLLTKTVPLFTQCIRGLTANEARCRELAAQARQPS